MTKASRHIAFLIICTTTVIGIAGTDLVLPVIPTLPRILGGTAATAQAALAAFSAGAAIGLLALGEIGSRWGIRPTMILAIGLYALFSGLCSVAPSLEALVGLRFMQGFFGWAGAAFAPGLIRSLYGDRDAIKALGAISSIEALVPAIAPLVGVLLLATGPWWLPFGVLGVASLIVLLLAWIFIPRGTARDISQNRTKGSYWTLGSNSYFARACISHALALSSILVLVFSLPAVITGPLNGKISDFIIIQFSGIVCFIVAATSSQWVVGKVGVRNVVLGGSVIEALGLASILAAAFIGWTNLIGLVGLFCVANGGLGLRGPAGFHEALKASSGDDARAASLLAVSVLALTALGTYAVADSVSDGLFYPALCSLIFAVLALVLQVSLQSNQRRHEAVTQE